MIANLIYTGDRHEIINKLQYDLKFFAFLTNFEQI